MRVVAFTGMPGAGKSEALEVGRARGYPVLRMGDFVWEETRRRGLELVDANVGKVATEMRQQHGADVWAVRTCDAILQMHAHAPLILIDGVRNHEEVETFRKRLGDRFDLVAVTAAPRERVGRLLKRRRPDDPPVEDEIRKRDERELGWGIAKSIAMADHTLVNQGDLATFRRVVEAFFDGFKA